MQSLRAFKPLGEPEINKDYSASLKQEVLGLDVAMNNSLSV